MPDCGSCIANLICEVYTLFYRMNSSYLLSQLIIFGSQTFAVPTPGSIKLNKYILVSIIDNLVKVLSNKDLENNINPINNILALFFEDVDELHVSWVS